MENLENTNNNAEITDEDIMLHLFQHAINTKFRPERKQEMQRLAEKYFGAKAELNSMATMITSAFVYGVEEGIRLCETLNREEDIQEDK